MNAQAAGHGVNWIDSLGVFLQYGLLGFSAILVILGFVLFYKTVSADTFNEQRYRASRFFLVFSVVFLFASAAVKLADDAMNPEATIQVEIEPWDKTQMAQYDITEDFFIKHGDARKYTGQAMKESVASGSQIRCVIYPLYSRLRQLSLQLAQGAVSDSENTASGDLGIEPIERRR